MSSLIKSNAEQLHLSLNDNISSREKRKLGYEVSAILLSSAIILAVWIYEFIFTGNNIIANLLLLTAALIVSLPIFKETLFDLFKCNKCTANTEQLVSLALLATIAKGDYKTASLVPILMIITHYIEERGVQGTKTAIEGLKKLHPDQAFLLTKDGEKRVKASSLQMANLIVVHPGDLIPIDGVITEGHSAIDQSSLTGEMIPADKKKGDQVFAGTVNIQGRLIVRVEKVVKQSSLYNIIKLLKNAEESEPQMIGLINKYISYYQPLVLIFAMSVLFLTMDLDRLIAILVVSCPCAQILASSTAMIAALAVITRNGILVKNLKTLELAWKIKKIAFDKTGTITEGNLQLVDIIPLNGYKQEELLNKAITAAQGSRHPIARAIINKAESLSLNNLEHNHNQNNKQLSIEEKTGLGIIAIKEEKKILLGRRSFLENEEIVLPEEPCHDGPIAWVAVEKEALGVILLADCIRKEAKKTIEKVRSLKLEKLILLTGDRQEVAENIGHQLNFDQISAELLPANKLEMVKAEKENGSKLMFIGDGINDALAMAEADLSIAMGAMGSDIAIQSADIVFMNNNLNKIPFIISLSKKISKTIFQNLLIASLASLVMLSLASTGIITPLIGAFFHNIGGLFVLINSARLLKENISG